MVALRVKQNQRLMEPPVKWLTASPLWEPFAEIKERSDAPPPNVQAPVLLRFTTDSFMDDFIRVVTNTPERLGEYRAIRETWRQPAPVPPRRASEIIYSAADVLEGCSEDNTLEGPLKLYMPAHQRYYLVVANLVCRIPGLPDKMLNFSKGEQASFVMRRYFDDAEYAMVNESWQEISVGSEQTVDPRETRFPMFPITYQDADGFQRRVFAGLVPVSQREAMITAAKRDPAVPDEASEGGVVDMTALRIRQLLRVLWGDVIGPWQAINLSWLVEDARLVKSFTDITNSPILSSSQKDTAKADLRAALVKTRDGLQMQSWYTILDLANYLKKHLTAVWNFIYATPDGAVPTGTPGKALIEALQDVTFRLETSTASNDVNSLRDLLRGKTGTTGAVTLTRALKAVYDGEERLEKTMLTYPNPDETWPAVQFLLCGRNAQGLIDVDEDGVAVIEALVKAALEELPPVLGRIPIAPAAKALAEAIENTDYDNDTFVIRCVFERPNCPPSIRPTVVSDPTEEFQMAAFFDPDAPSRPVRVPMPIDTTPAGLRKFSKNTMFVLSDMMACQVQKMRGITFADLIFSILPWPFHRDLPLGGDCGPGFGMICSLSIPIVTICALILLIIIVSLLDFVFKWLPFLILCFPLPGLKAKKAQLATP